MTRVAVISTVRAPLQELQMFVNYHLNIGINEIILFFDDPLDPCIDSLSKYKQVSIVACTHEYWSKESGNKPDAIEDRQVVNVNGGAQIALAKKCDWIVHIDSDELISSSVKISHILQGCNADAVRFNMMEAVSEKEEYDNIFSATLFKKNSSEINLRRAKFLGCSYSLFEGEYFRGHTASKMAIRVSAKFTSLGIHGPREYDRTKTTIKDTEDIKLLHYDCVGFDNWNTKWNRRLDGSGRALEMRENRAKQYEAYVQAKKKGSKELSSLFRHLHIMPKREKGILFLLGMLTRVNLDRSLFSSPR